MTPKTKAAESVIAKAKRTTPPSSVMSSTRGREAGAKPSKRRTPTMASMTPPPYTGLESTTEERGDFSVPEGTLLDLEFLCSSVIESGQITRDGDPTTEQELSIEVLSGEDEVDNFGLGGDPEFGGFV